VLVLLQLGQLGWNPFTNLSLLPGPTQCLTTLATRWSALAEDGCYVQQRVQDDLHQMKNLVLYAAMQMGGRA